MNARTDHEVIRDSLISALSQQKADAVRSLLGLAEEVPGSVDDSIADAFASLGDAIDNWAELEAIKEVERMEDNRKVSAEEDRADRLMLDYQLRRLERA